MLEAWLGFCVLCGLFVGIGHRVFGDEPQLVIRTAREGQAKVGFALWMWGFMTGVSLMALLYRAF